MQTLSTKQCKEVDTIVHFAAESHVDRSILEPGDFVKTNVLGTQVLLDAALKIEQKDFIIFQQMKYMEALISTIRTYLMNEHFIIPEVHIQPVKPAQTI